MRDYFYDVETVRLAVVLGVVVSMLFYERMQLTSGGAIVPAYFALFLPYPLFVVYTLAAGYATYYLVSVVLARRRILYGRRKFELEILVGLAFIAVGTLVGSALADWDVTFVALAGVGFVTPGVLAHVVPPSSSFSLSPRSHPRVPRLRCRLLTQAPWPTPLSCC